MDENSFGKRPVDPTGTNDEPAKLGFQNVVRLGYVSLFTDFSSEMIFSILPLFVHEQLGASYAIIGLMEGSAEAANDFLRILTGVITDRVAKRKPLVLLGYALSTFAKPLFAVATTWGQAFIVRVTDRAGKGARTSPRDALISDSIAKSESGKAFGVQSSLDQVGAVVGPLLAFFVFPSLGFKGIFWLSFVPGTISLIILLFFVREAVGLKKQGHLFESAKVVLTRKFAFLLVALTIFSVGAYNFSFILLRASSLGVSDAEIPLVYVVINAVTVVVALGCGILADKVGKLAVLLLSFVAFAVTSAAGILLIGAWVYGFIIAFLFGIYLGASDTVQRAMIPDFTKPEFKGTAYAFYYVLVGLGSFAANSIFGYLWTSINYSVAFQFSLVVSAASMVALLIFMAVYRSNRN
jgi:MFS family permease